MRFGRARRIHLVGAVGHRRQGTQIEGPVITDRGELRIGAEHEGADTDDRHT